MAEQNPPPRPSLKLPAKPGMPVKPPGGPTPQFDVTKSPFKEPNPGAANSPQSAALPLQQVLPVAPPFPRQDHSSKLSRNSPLLQLQHLQVPLQKFLPHLQFNPLHLLLRLPPSCIIFRANSSCFSIAASFPSFFPPIAQPAPIASPTPPIGGAGIPVPGKSEDKTSSASISTEKMFLQSPKINPVSYS